MPTLNWIGKDAVVNHHRQVPFHLLRVDPARSVGDRDSASLLIEGDNLLALKALLPYYAGQVSCVCIDPPYNTGNENWAYNDNVNSPQMREWLGRVVGKQGEDLSRHDKWLCMMYPRLALLREFLREDGAIFVFLDDNEIGHGRLLMDELFGGDNFIATLAWQRRISPDARLGLSRAHDHVLVYARQFNAVSFNKIQRSGEQARAFRNPDNDPRGPWVSTDFSAQGWRPNQMYSITTPGGRTYQPPPGRCWSNTEAEYHRLLAEGRMWFGKKGQSRPRVKTYLSESEGISAWSWLPHSEAGHNQEAKKEIHQILGHDVPFDTPKPVRLIERILQIATRPGDLVLDSFAGSGTTGHAALKLGSGRRFILIEMEPAVAGPITAERMRRVIQGYGDTPGLGGGFQYCTLGPALFDAAGRIRPEVSYDDLAAFVYFRATGAALLGRSPPKRTGSRTPLLGVHNGVAVYLLYNGVLKDKSSDGGNALTRRTLAGLPPHPGPKIIYGTRCLIGEDRLRRELITFRHIPVDLAV